MISKGKRGRERKRELGLVKSSAGYLNPGLITRTALMEGPSFLCHRHSREPVFCFFFLLEISRDYNHGVGKRKTLCMRGGSGR